MNEVAKAAGPLSWAASVWVSYPDSAGSIWLLSDRPFDIEAKRRGNSSPPKGWHRNWITFGGPHLLRGGALSPDYFVSVQILEFASSRPQLGGLSIDWHPRMNPLRDIAIDPASVPRAAVTVEQIRQLPLAEMVKYGARVLKADRADRLQTTDDLAPFVGQGKPPKGSVNESAFLHGVRQTFLDAVSVGESGQQAVAKYCNVSVSQAARYIARARELGIIEQSARSRKGQESNG